MTSASTTIENEKNKAKEELREQMSEIIIDTTQKILGDEISKEKHEEILKSSRGIIGSDRTNPFSQTICKSAF